MALDVASTHSTNVYVYPQGPFAICSTFERDADRDGEWNDGYRRVSY